MDNVYRAYLLDEQNHFVGVLILTCEDDDAAIRRVRQINNSHDLEIWQCGRFVAKLAQRA